MFRKTIILFSGNIGFHVYRIIHQSFYILLRILGTHDYIEPEIRSIKLKSRGPKFAERTMMSRQIFNRSAKVDGIDIFYREAGDRKNPSILLLHGFPTSSVMFKNLMVVLSDKFHLIAPDYPGFGFSAFPNRNNFEYSFKNISAYINKFTEEIDLKSFTIYLHDYGCPIGLRICVNHPEKIERIIVQNGNAYLEGIEPQWDEIGDYWEHPTEEKKQKVYAFLSKDGTKMQYTAGLPEELLTCVSPETWLLDWVRMSRPGNIETMTGNGKQRIMHNGVVHYSRMTYCCRQIKKINNRSEV